MISKRVYAALAVFFAFFGCKQELGMQDPEEIFSNGKLPGLLEKSTNPRPNPQTVGQYDERSNLTVAVIDEGVDYNHPYLRDKVKYTYEEGNIVGAGWDFLGNDAWAHPNVIEAGLFSFGAIVSDEGKIALPLSNPLKELDRFNDQFIDSFLQALNAEPKLNGTFFRKLDRHNITYLGVLNIVIGTLANNLAYTKHVHRNLTIDPSTVTNPKHDVMELLKKYPEGLTRVVFDQPWSMDGSLGTPDFEPTNVICEANSDCGASDLTYWRGFDVFLTIADKQVTDFEKQTQFREKYLAPFSKYRNANLPLSERSKVTDEAEEIKSIKGLQRSWYGAKLNFRNYDPAFGAARIFCLSLSNDEYAHLRSPHTTPDQKKAIISSHIDQAYADADRTNTLIANRDISPRDERKEAVKELKASATYKKMVYSTVDQRDWSMFYCDPQPEWSSANYKFEDAYNNFARRAFNPYLNEESSEKSHGTHVSGIIATQEPAVKILPVKVLVESHSSTPTIDEKKKADFLNKFQTWLANGLVFKATAERLSPFVNKSPDQVTLADLMNLSKEALDILYEEDKTTILFMDQVVQAAEYVGKVGHAKVANISLGDGFEQPVAKADAEEDEAIKDQVQFLIFEYYKYQLSQALSDSQDTLFVIAAGNDNAWLDGESRSGLPCDVSSSWLREYAAKNHLPAPPNAIVSNTLCVGSLDKNRHLSSYTNIILNLKQPFVFSYGEEILSALKTEDCNGVTHDLKKAAGHAPELTDNEKLWQEIYRKDHGDPANNDQKEKEKNDLTVQGHSVELEAALLKQLHREAIQHACVMSSDFKQGRMSGTSMATPAVTGLIAKYALAKMKKMGLTEAQAYAHPEFKPRKLVEEVSKINESFGGESRLKDVKNIVAGFKTFTPGATYQLPQVRGLDLGLGSGVGAAVVLP